MDPTKEHHQIVCKSRKNCDLAPINDYTSIWGRNSRARKVQTHQDRKKGETGEEQSQEHAHQFSFTLRGMFAKNPSWQTKESILHTALTFYADCS
jgi:hypothetical protein